MTRREARSLRYITGHFETQFIGAPPGSTRGGLAIVAARYEDKTGHPAKEVLKRGPSSGKLRRPQDDDARRIVSSNCSMDHAPLSRLYGD
jgi:hypothetical protein